MFNWMRHTHESNRPEVLVVGAGPVGMLAAIVLAQRGIRVQIVDRELGIGTRSYALALHGRTLSLLKELDLLGDLLSRAHEVHSVALYSGRQHRGEMRLGDLDEEYPFLAVIQQSILEDLFERSIERLGVRVLWNHEFVGLKGVDDHVSVTIDQLEKESLGYSVAHTEWIVAKSRDLHVPFVFGADGHDSDVRKAAGIDERHLSTPRHFAVYEFRTDADLGHEARVAFEDGTTNVLWPLPGGRARWGFELPELTDGWDSREKDRFFLQIPGDQGEILRDDHLPELIAERAPWFDGSIDEITWRSHARFEGRRADAFGRGRIWLAGDAAHLTGPVGVQSMNVGLREARELADLLADILHGIGSPDDLYRYNAERLAEWDLLHGLNAELQFDADAPEWLRAIGHEIITTIPASGDILSALARQLGTRQRVIEPALG